MNEDFQEKRKTVSKWLGVFVLSFLFMFIFVRATIPAWGDAREIRDEKNRLYAENVSLEKEIASYRLEKENLLHSYYYNERIRRLLFQTGPESK